MPRGVRPAGSAIARAGSARTRSPTASVARRASSAASAQAITSTGRPRAGRRGLSDRAEQALELLPRDSGSGDELEVFVDVRNALHADQRGPDAGRRADELEGALRVRAQPGEKIPDEGRQIPGELALVDRG